MAQTFTNKGPRERVTPTRQRVETWKGQDTSSSGKGTGTYTETFERAPQRNRRAALRKPREAAETPDTTEGENEPQEGAQAVRESGVVAPAEVAVKASPRKRVRAPRKAKS